MSVKAIERIGSAKLTDRWSDHEKAQVVYFLSAKPLGSHDVPVIKVGESSNYEKRLKDHRKPKHGQAFDIGELCVVQGTRDDEQQALRYFDEHRLENEKETFHPHADVVDYIRWLRDQYFVWVPDCDQCEPIHKLDVVDASLWLPNSERRKPAPIQRTMFDEFGSLNLPPREVTVDDFYTNKIIIEAARRTLGRIDLDPASHAYANSVVKAAKFYTLHDNGLEKEWDGCVWINPPFSKWQSWVPKILREWQSGRVKAMCILSATRTITAQYFADIRRSCTGMCILNGRIRFWGGRAGDPDDGHVIFYFGNDIKKFRREYSELGNTFALLPE